MASPPLPMTVGDTAGEVAAREPGISSPLSVIVSLSMAATVLSLIFAGILSLIVWGIAS
ncbi:MAG TPA: hypothetical protein VHY84_08105 [Bryobacteraceae bacterium]|nr:hypothetical protein [Bryobacteraceae bacterium]